MTSTKITRRWHEVWVCKFVWVEGEFNQNGDVVEVVYRLCTVMMGRRKMMVPKMDNLKKYEGKHTCKEDGVPLLGFKKGNAFVKT